MLTCGRPAQTPPHPGEETKSLEGGDKAGICFLEMHITTAMEGRTELYILKGKAWAAFTVSPIEPMFGIIKIDVIKANVSCN